jgi:hypothetical protein
VDRALTVKPLEDASRLEALRSAVRVGVDDFEQGRYYSFCFGMGEPDALATSPFRIFRLFVYFGYTSSHDAV